MLCTALYALIACTSAQYANEAPIAPYAAVSAVNTAYEEQVVQDKSHLEQFPAQVTGYSAIETCSTTCNMATGKRAYYGAAACPRRIPLGTWIDVEGLGVFLCEDRTADWTDGRFDIFFGYEMLDYDKAIKWGNQIRIITINHAI